MKFLGFLAAVALANDEYPHDPEAMEYCQGLPGGYYPHPEDCDTYYVCWNYGLMGDKFVCDTGLVWHQRLLMCDWPFNLPPTDPCYEPL